MNYWNLYLPINTAHQRYSEIREVPVYRYLHIKKLYKRQQGMHSHALLPICHHNNILLKKYICIYYTELIKYQFLLILDVCVDDSG